MATPSSKPAWATEMDGVDLDPGLDAAMVADVEAAMKSYEGRLAPNRKFAPGTFDPAKSVVWRPDEEVAPASASTPVTDPATQAGVQTPIQPGTDAVGSEDRPAGGAIPADQDPDAPTTQGGSTPAPPTGPDAPMVDVDSTYLVKLANGTDFAMNQDQAKYLLELHNWMDSQAPVIKEQWGQIERGEAVAVPQSDYEKFKAWQAEQAKPKPVELPQPPAGYDPTLVDDATARYIANLQETAKNAVIPPVAPAVDPAPTPPTETEIQQRVQNTLAQQQASQAALDSASKIMSEEWGLDANQVALLQSVTPTLNIIPGIAQKMRRYSPTGQLLQEPSLHDVYTEAFRTAMVMDPSLRTIRDNVILQQAMSTTGSTNPAVAAANLKKANAGSLATAPSAAVPGRQVDMTKMTKVQREQYAREQMVHEIGEAMAGR